MTGRLDGKTAVVTGAGSGIGRAIATALHAEGAKVVLGDISGAEKELAANLGDRAFAVHADVSNASEVDALVTAAVEVSGGLHVMVNNAGIDGGFAPVADCTEENFDRVIAINLKGVFLGMKSAIPRIVDSGGGSIINIASAAGSVGFPMMPAYCASKGGVVQLTRTGALEYAGAGIRMNVVSPGVIDTPLVQGVGPALTSPAIAQTPLGRLGQASELGGMAVFLASDESSFVTGAVFAVDGGFTAH